MENETRELKRRVGILTWAVVLLGVVNIGMLVMLGGWMMMQRQSWESDAPWGRLVSPSSSESALQQAMDDEAAKLEKALRSTGAPSGALAYHEQSSEDKIRGASVIALADYEERDGELVTVISEILKKDPEVEFYYEVGDEVGHGIPIEEGVRYGEGQVVFFAGSPASMRTASSIHGGRVGSMGDMPVKQLRAMIESLAKTP